MNGRSAAESIFRAAIDGSAPGAHTAEAVRSLAIPNGRRIWLYAAGKASHAMADSAASALRASLRDVIGGIVVGQEVRTTPYPTLIACVGDHPVPARASFT